MLKRKFKPTWRNYGGDVEIVTDPTSAWFAALTPFGALRCVRYAIMEDGEVLWGDAYHVLHKDIAHLGRVVVRPDGDRDEVLPLLGGSFIRRDRLWSVGICQFYGKAREASILRASGLLRRSAAWPLVVRAMGNDPFDHVPAEEPEDV